MQTYIRKQNSSFWLTLLLIWSIASYSYGQATSTDVVGKVIDPLTEEAMKFANVLLYNNGDDIFLASVKTDSLGQFRFSDMSVGTYYMELSVVGFETYKTDSFKIEKTTDEIDLGLVPFEENNSSLEKEKLSLKKSPEEVMEFANSLRANKGIDMTFENKNNDVFILHDEKDNGGLLLFPSIFNDPYYLKLKKIGFETQKNELSKTESAVADSGLVVVPIENDTTLRGDTIVNNLEVLKEKSVDDLLAESKEADVEEVTLRSTISNTETTGLIVVPITIDTAIKEDTSVNNLEVLTEKPVDDLLAESKEADVEEDTLRSTISNTETLQVVNRQPSQAIVVGEVMEASTEEIIEFVNVSLHDNSNDHFVTGGTTNDEGQFQFSEIPVGEYYLLLSFIGFETKKTEPFQIENFADEIDLGEIRIEINSTILETVEVTEEKSIYNLAIDRKVYNVEKDIMASTSSATEILQNIPSVSVDVNGQISLRGSSNITYFINGKPSAMMRINSTATLQQMPANMIERVEVITNPSAKYKPDGVGGIINIVLKKESGSGLNGTITGNLGNLERYNGSLTLNYGVDDINFYTSYGIRHSDTPRDDIENIINKDSLTGKSLSLFDKNIEAQYNEFSHLINAGMEWEFNDWDVLEVTGSYFLANNEDIKTTTAFFDDLSPDNEDESTTTDLVLDEKEQEYEVGLVFEHQFEEDHALAFEYVYADFFEKEAGTYSQRFAVPAIRDSFIKNNIEISGPTHEVALEYVLPFGEDTEFEAGYVGEFMEEDITFRGESKSSLEGTYEVDPARTSQFIFTQNIHALYATFGHAIENISFLAGLRAEQAYVTSHLVSTNEKFSNDYFKVYPTLHLNCEIDKYQQLQLSYSKRVNRADSDEQNPFPEYADPNRRDVGNPKLKPEQVHSFELGFRFQKNNFTFLPSLYYRYKVDGFTEIVKTVENDITETTFTNLETDESAGVEFILTGNVTDNLKFDLSSNFFYQQIDARNLGLSPNKASYSWDSKLGLNINITKSTYGQLNAYYRSSRITPQGEFNPIFLLNAGIRQDIIKNQASLMLTVSDIFNTLDYESTIDSKKLYQNTRYGRNSQIVYLGFVYHFGKRIKKQKKTLSFEDKVEAGKQVDEDEDEE